MDVLSNHGIVGGSHSNLVLAVRDIGHLSCDTAAGVGGDTAQNSGIAETAIAIGKFCDDLVGFGVVEVVRRHGSSQSEGNGNGIVGGVAAGSQLVQCQGRIIDEQGIINKQIVAGATLAGILVGGGHEEYIAHISARAVVGERDAQPSPVIVAVGRCGAGERL